MPEVVPAPVRVQEDGLRSGDVRRRLRVDQRGRRADSMGPEDRRPDAAAEGVACALDPCPLECRRAVDAVVDVAAPVGGQRTRCARISERNVRHRPAPRIERQDEPLLLFDHAPAKTGNRAERGEDAAVDRACRRRVERDAEPRQRVDVQQQFASVAHGVRDPGRGLAFERDGQDGDLGRRRGELQRVGRLDAARRAMRGEGG